MDASVTIAPSPSPDVRGNRRSALLAALKCSDCKLTFAPVIHTTTRTPFYNECLGRCQLGDEEVFEPVRSTVGDGEQAQADPITQLLPLPVNAAGEGCVHAFP